MIMTTLMSWQQDADATWRQLPQRERHKQRHQSDRVNIPAAYEDGNDNKDGNIEALHNQSNTINGISTNFSSSAQRQRKPQRPHPPVGLKPRMSLAGFQSFPGLVLGFLFVAALAVSADESTTSTASSPYTNDTDYSILFGESTTDMVASQTTGLPGVGLEQFEDEEDEEASEYIFDRTDVRIIFITLYSIVFCCCFFGKFQNLYIDYIINLSFVSLNLTYSLSEKHWASSYNHILNTVNTANLNAFINEK